MSDERRRLAEEIVAKLMNRNVDAVWVITQALDDVVAQAEREREEAVGCKANRAADPPQDCDMPFCGCNPAWLTLNEATALYQERDAARAELERLKEYVGEPGGPPYNELVAENDRLAAALARVRAALDWKRDADAAGDDAIWERGYNAAIEHMRAALKGR